MYFYPFLAHILHILELQNVLSQCGHVKIYEWKHFHRWVDDAYATYKNGNWIKHILIKWNMQRYFFTKKQSHFDFQKTTSKITYYLPFVSSYVIFPTDYKTTAS